MLHHAMLELAPGDLERTLELWGLLGFERVEPPEVLRERFVWMQRDGTQIHIERNAWPTVPPRGHVAVLVADFEATVERLREAGFEVNAGQEYWGAARAKVAAPGGHTIELMAAPPGRE